MSILTPGANAPVPSSNITATVTLHPIPGVDVDVSAFLLKADGKVRNDDDMCFYGQPSVCGGNVVLVGSEEGRTVFRLNLSSIDAGIEKVSLTATIHENKVRFASFFDIQLDLGGLKATVPTDGKTETALILGEFYRRNGEWKFRCVGQGFEGGLAPLATHFGVVVDDATPAATPVPATPPPSAPAPTKVSLEKRVADKAPHLVSLAKKVQVTLEKKNLADVVATVALVLDKSGSMAFQYSNGRVQEVVDRIVPLAVHFDDNEELDCWTFADKQKRLPNVTLGNVRDYVKKEVEKFGVFKIGVGNNEPVVIKEIVDFYRHQGGKTPVFVIFISDGGIYKNAEIKKLIKDASGLPIFWQFVGIGGRGYGALAELDTMSGRVVDNAGFFAIDDLRKVSEEELYDRLMSEFPVWLKAAKAKGIIA
ncbi:VWA domain-containing protein [Pararhizobium sp. BT-229]|uniref:vWA domain-containing protein n=1 Tax=Pararhizobium sp. BT-229 TaxID=2986923 RepID=UPI0021F756C5|nr:VWA domain-containing protein [Pararhizobium sp. BT-229]MCV9964731.1 VWA domain-containing protein [Pararhizobium sp. BT-229]